MHPSLEFVERTREQSCRVVGCPNPVEPHHLDVIGMGRNRKRPMAEHYSTVALCRKHHQMIEDCMDDREIFDKFGNLWYWQMLRLEQELFKRDQHEED